MLAMLKGRGGSLPSRRRIVLGVGFAVVLALLGPTAFRTTTTATASGRHRSKHHHHHRAHKARRGGGQAPTAATSYYMRTADPNIAYAMGCSFGKSMGRGSKPADSLVVLDFGAPHRHHHRTYGTTLFESGFASNPQIETAGVRYAKGYWDCTRQRPKATLRIAMGTSNYGRQVTFGHGRAWAQMVNDANQGLARLHIDSRIDVAGADDFEPQWSGPVAARAWVQGYDSVNEWPYYDYGAAVGCPPYGNCAGAWTLEDVWYVAWGAKPALPLPEIYTGNGANAKQWFRLSLYSAVRHKSRMVIAGVMSQHRACKQRTDPCWGMNNTAPRAWRQLSKLLNSDHRTAQDVRWVTDISWGARPHRHHRPKHRHHSRHGSRKKAHHKAHRVGVAGSGQQLGDGTLDPGLKPFPDPMRWADQ